jgi:hypothetical protein
VGANHLRIGIAAFLLASAAITVVTVATAGARDSTPVLHEDLDTPPEQARRSAELLRGAIFGSPPRPGANPTAFSSGERILPRPAAAAGDAARDSGAADRDTAFRADRTHPRRRSARLPGGVQPLGRAA